MIDIEFTRKILKKFFWKIYRRKFLLLEPLPDDVSQFLFYGNEVSHVNFFCVEFHDYRPNSLGRDESKRNHRSGSKRNSLVQLNK